MIPGSRTLRRTRSSIRSSTTSHAYRALAIMIALWAGPAVGQTPTGSMTCHLSSDTATPGSTVTLEVFLQNTADVRGYQATIAITRTSGSGAVGVACGGGVTVDQDRSDFVFFGLDTANLQPDCANCGIVAPFCEGQRVAAARVNGSVDVGITAKYLATFTLNVSADATPGSTFAIAVLPFPASIVGGSNNRAIPFTPGPSCVLTIVEPPLPRIPTVSEWGVVVLTLLLLIGAKVYFGHRGLGAGRTVTRAGVLFALLWTLGHSASAAPVCISNADCDDSNVCTFDLCVNGSCSNVPVRHGDVAGANGCGPDGTVDLLDINVMRNALRNVYSAGCGPQNFDIESANGCTPDGKVDLFDLFGVLSAFAGRSKCPCPEPVVDLVVDTDRNTVVDDNDEPQKDQFNDQRGAVLLVNLDDDDLDGAADSTNNEIDAAPDPEDITDLVIRKSGWAVVPEGVEYVIRMDKDIAARRARIFPGKGAGTVEVLGPDTVMVKGNYKEYVIPNAQMAGSGSLQWGIEGITYPQQDSTDPTNPAKNFDGLVEVELVYRITRTQQILASDKVLLRSTPWMMLGHLHTNKQVFVVELTGAAAASLNGQFVTDLNNILNAIGGVTLTKVAGATYGEDRWMQDQIEIGFDGAPISIAPAVKTIHSVFDGPRNRGLSLKGYAAAELLGDGTAVFEVPTAAAVNSLDSFGNLEVTPRLTVDGIDYLFGLIYYGGNAADRRMQREVREFFDAQEYKPGKAVQSPVELDSDWLLVGHVDEFISFVPFPNAGGGDKKFKVLLASPKKAIDILEAEEAAWVRLGRPEPEPEIAKLGQKITEVLGAYRVENINTWQPKVDAVKTIMKPRMGLVDDDFIDVPVLFRTEFDTNGKAKAVGYLPDVVNLLVVNGHVIVPEPFYDPFKKDFETKLAGIGYKKPTDANPTIHFLDDYEWYHLSYGEVHCGTNSRREIPDDPKWWEQK